MARNLLCGTAGCSRPPGIRPASRISDGQDAPMVDQALTDQRPGRLTAGLLVGRLFLLLSPPTPWSAKAMNVNPRISISFHLSGSLTSTQPLDLAAAGRPGPGDNGLLEHGSCMNDGTRKCQADVPSAISVNSPSFKPSPSTRRWRRPVARMVLHPDLPKPVRRPPLPGGHPSASIPSISHSGLRSQAD